MIGEKQAIAEWILKRDDIAVFTHARPDGDAYGSAFALTLAIQSLGKRAFAACADPVEERYAFLPSNRLFGKDDMPFQPKSILCADVSDTKLLGSLEEMFLACGDTAALDHHATNSGFAMVNYVDEHAAAAGELALEVIQALGVEITEAIAVNIYTAIATDTGNFSYKSTGARTYRAAAVCAESGVNIENVSRKLFRTSSYARTKLLGIALSHLQMYENGRVAGIMLTDDMYRSAGAARADAHGIVNYLNEIEGVLVGVFAEETPDGGVKLSFRGTGSANVAALAQKFGGGGHILAAGAMLPDAKLSQVYPEVIQAACAHAREME